MNIYRASRTLHQRRSSGQALVEYALILILVVLALAAALIATGPALGNVFSNTVYNLLGQNTTPQDLSRGGPTDFWETVTEVAANPPRETPFPTGDRPGGVEGTARPTVTASNTQPTAIPTNTPVPTISPTPTDAAFTAPYVDPVNNPDWWRVDTSVYLGGEDWKGEYYSAPNFGGTLYSHRGRNFVWNYEVFEIWNGGPNHRYNIDFNWPNLQEVFPGWNHDSFSVRWTRHFVLANPLTVNLKVRVGSDESFSLKDNGTVINSWSQWTSDNGNRNVNYTFAAGDHVLTFEYKEASGDAYAFLEITQPKWNTPDDANLSGGDPRCGWGRINGTQPNTLAWAWYDNPSSFNGLEPNMLCHLELRGYIDTSTLLAPELSFWDVWDLAGTASVDVQIAEYVPYAADMSSGGPDWATGLTLPLHSGTSNYNWTRYAIDLSGLGYTKVAIRFRVRSAPGAGIYRWYLDDVSVKDRNLRTYYVCHDPKATCGSYWNMDSQSQKDDFIASGRWGLSSGLSAYGGAGTAWDDSADVLYYSDFGAEQDATNGLRIHSLEFSGQIDLTDINSDGTGGQPDYQGDDGMPLLTFQSSHDLDAGDRIEIQWTRDARDNVPDNWTRVGAVLASGVSLNGYHPETVRLDSIPNWNTLPFRLRFALIVDKTSNSRKGWNIDEILIEREGLPRYSQYPFCDTAELGTEKWFLTGTWGLASNGVFGSSRSYTDSPLGNYIHGSNSALELRYAIDYDNDSPENLTVWGGNKDCNGNPSGPAVHPMLSFWHWRNLNPDEGIYVDVYRAANAGTGTAAIAWTPVWGYTYNATTRDQLAWERVEIDMVRAIEQVTGLSWATLTSNADTHDDDFFFRIRLDARVNTVVDDGIYVDNIDVYENIETVHKLWSQFDNPGGLGFGGGDYLDNIDQPSAWWQRWRNGGDWNGIDWDSRSGVKSFTDSPPQGVTYRHSTFGVLEMNTIIDLRGTQNTDKPIMFFWSRFNIGASDFALVQVAPENTAQNVQQYERLYHWDAWQTVWSKNETARRDTWGREQVDLTPYIGTRLRVRFVLYAYSNSSYLRDGWWIDDVQFRIASPTNPVVYGIPFFDNAQNTANWVTEGIWGLAPDLWKGTGGGPASLGPNPWYGYFIDCSGSCNTGQANTLLNSVPVPSAYPDTGSYVAAMEAYEAANPGKVLRDYISDINHDFGSVGRPVGGEFNNTWSDYYAGRWVRDITVAAGDYTFIARSDDGIRMRYETVPAGGEPPGWNLLESWKYQSANVPFMVTVTLPAGNYRLILEWFEATGSAVIQTTIGNNVFSFSDSPRATAAGPVVQSVQFGDSSLMLDGVLNLFNPSPSTPGYVWAPQLQFYTFYDLDTNNFARVEVSDTGGFTWTQTNLANGCTPACDNPQISGSAQWMPPPVGTKDWRLRRHNLTSYANRFIGLRFRLTTDNNVNDGWWITEITVNN